MKALALLLLSSTALAKAPLAKDTKHGPVPRDGTKPRPLINLYNQWTDEWLAVDPKTPPSAGTLNRFLRDHYTSDSMVMEPKLLGFVVRAADHFHAPVVTIVSGFRSPKYNLILRKKGHQVARDSQHTHGNAIDFALPGVTIPRLHRWAIDQHAGGVGLYLASGFVHMDTGPRRTWSGE